MDIESAITAYLLSKAGLNALVGNRIFMDTIPQGTVLPCVCWQKVSDIKEHLLSGQETLESPMYQFSAFADTKPVMRAITNQLKAALSDYHGTLSGIEVQKIELQNEMYTYNTSGNRAEGALRTYIENLEYEINFIRG
jgi:hypothetical protein